MAEVCKLTGSWIPFKDSISNGFRIKLPLVICVKYQAGALLRAQKVSHPALAPLARLGQMSRTYFDECTP
jgi:hypothetical protein